MLQRPWKFRTENSRLLLYSLVAALCVLPSFASSRHLGQGYVYDIAMSPDGGRVAVLRRADIEIWDSGIRHLIRRISVEGGHYESVQWSPDGTRIAARFADIDIWDVETGAKVQRVQGGAGGGLRAAWSPKGDRLAVPDDSGVYIYDLAKPSSPAIEVPRSQLFSQNCVWVQELGWSGDGDLLAVQTCGTVTIWSFSQGKPVASVHPSRRAPELARGSKLLLAWSPREPLLATCGNDNVVQIWNPKDGTLVEAHSAEDGPHSSLSWSRRGDRIALATRRGLTVWELGSSRPPLTTRSGIPADYAAFSPDLGSAVTADSSGEFEIWPSVGNEGGYRVQSLIAESEFVAWSPRGDRLASWSSSGNVQVWDVASETVAYAFRAAIWGRQSVVWSPDGTRLAAARDDGVVTLRDGASGDDLRALGQAGTPVYGLAWSPDGSRIAALFGTGLRVWSPYSLSAVREIPMKAIELAWTSANTILTSSFDGTVIEFDATNGTRTWSFTPPSPSKHGRYHSRAWLSPDGRSFVAWPSGTVWARADRNAPPEKVGPAVGIQGSPWYFDSPDGMCDPLALYKSATALPGRVPGPHRRWRLPPNASSFACSYDGKWVAIVNAGGLVYIWDGGSAAPVGGYQMALGRASVSLWPYWPEFTRYNGAVVDATTGGPIPNASVNIGACKAVTDAAGRFRVDCPYSTEDHVAASKPGYLSQRGVPLDRGDDLEGPSGNRIMREIVWELLAMATLHGDVFYAGGARAPNAVVTLQALNGRAGTVRQTTDQNGHFRLQAAPGDYSICAVPEYQVHRSWKVPKHPPSTIPVKACLTTQAGGPDAAVLTLKQADVAGPFEMRLGEEQAFSIRGRIEIQVPKTIDWGDQIWAIPERPEPAAVGSGLSGRITPHGRFLIEGLRAGTYTVLARSGRAPRCDTCPGGPLFYDAQRLELHRNVKGLVMTIRPNGVVTGRVILEGGGPDTRDRRVVGLRGSLPTDFSLQTSADVDAEGRFRIANVPPGGYRVEAQERHKDYVVSMRQDGRKLDDGRVQIEPGRSTDLEITVRKNTAMIEIGVLGARGVWPNDALLIAVPENAWDDPDSWWSGAGSLDSQPMRLGPLPPGTYFVIVAPYLIGAGGGYQGPSHDEVIHHRQEAVQVVLKDGETAKVPVKPISWGDE